MFPPKRGASVDEVGGRTSAGGPDGAPRVAAVVRDPDYQVADLQSEPVQVLLMVVPVFA